MRRTKRFSEPSKKVYVIHLFKIEVVMQIMVVTTIKPRLMGGTYLMTHKVIKTGYTQIWAAISRMEMGHLPHLMRVHLTLHRMTHLILQESIYHIHLQVFLLHTHHIRLMEGQMIPQKLCDKQGFEGLMLGENKHVGEKYGFTMDIFIFIFWNPLD